MRIGDGQVITTTIEGVVFIAREIIVLPVGIVNLGLYVYETCDQTVEQHTILFNNNFEIGYPCTLNKTSNCALGGPQVVEVRTIGLRSYKLLNFCIPKLLNFYYVYYYISQHYLL